MVATDINFEVISTFRSLYLVTYRECIMIEQYSNKIEIISTTVR